VSVGAAGLHDTICLIMSINYEQVTLSDKECAPTVNDDSGLHVAKGLS